MTDLRPKELTWTVLLGRWVEFAQASMALPAGAEGDRWRGSVADIITLQAVTFALAELDSLPREEHPYARDKAEVLIDGSTANLERAWRGSAMPDDLRELVEDARRALEASGRV